MAFSKPKAHERAERYAAKGQHDKAAREYQSIVENDPKDVRAWLMLADCLVRCGDKPGAVERYERVAQYYVDAKEHNKALAVFRQVLALDAERLDVQLKVAALNLQVGHTQDGIAIYERVAHAQLQTGRVADALNTYRLVADADPTVVARRLRLAELYSREKQRPAAVEAFRSAGEQLRRSGRTADFVRVAERLLYHDENDLPTVRELARAYLELGDPRRAIMKLNGLLRAHPKDEEGIELLADTFMALGKPEKALSALEELARGLKARGPEAKAQAIRVLRRGLEWRPGHAEFREALSELEGRRRTGPVAPVSESTHQEADDELGIEAVDEGDLVELDDDDLVEEFDESDAIGLEPSAPISLPEAASSAPGTRRTVEMEAVPSTEPSLTQSVLSEVEADAALAGAEGLTDFDKILFEARVYIKYRLFEHALEHVRAALLQQPEHVGAMIVQARALTELGRAVEAAESHLRVVELVGENDPKLAHEHLAAARGLAPQHPRIDLVAHGLAPVANAPTRVPATRAPLPAGDHGDSGAFDLVGPDDDLSPPGIALDLADEPPANLIPATADPEFSTQPFKPIDLERAEAAAPARSGQTVAYDEDDLEKLGPARTGQTISQMPGISDEPVPSTDVEALDFDGDLEADGTPEPIRSGDGAPTHAIDLDPELTDVVIDAPSGPEASMADMESEGPKSVAPEAEHVDLTDELDEIQFYVDQGLDDDANAALDDLAALHPGHPQIAKFRGHEPAEAPVAAASVPVVAAKPKPKPEPVPVVAAEPEPEPEPEPVPVVAVEPEPEPVPVVAVEPEPVPVVAVEPEPEPEPVPVVAVEPEPEPLLDFDLDDEVEDDGGAAAAPLVSLDAEPDEALVSFDDDDDEDAYLSAIFADPPKAKAKLLTEESTPGANLAAGQSVDAATAFDLGVAYREMGLVDSAITQFETAARDPQWRARSLTLLGSLRLHRGETDQAVADLKDAVRLASTPAETSEAAYELGVLYGVIGDNEAAIQQLLTVAPGYRDRDERLAELGF